MGPLLFYFSGAKEEIRLAIEKVLEIREVEAEAQKIAGLSQKNNIALLFGPEDTGLANDQLRLCHSVVTIPTSREFTSLNLAQAAMILCYEIFTASPEGGVALQAAQKLALASELEGMYGQIRELLTTIGFLNPQRRPCQPDGLAGHTAPQAGARRFPPADRFLR